MKKEMMYTSAASQISKQLLTSILLSLWMGASGCTDESLPLPSPMQPPEADISLDSLLISPGDLQPAFARTVTSYVSFVSAPVTSITVAASPKDTSTTLAINGVITPAGQEQTVTLRPTGMPTPVEVVLSSADGRMNTYNVMVTRLASREVSLSSLSVDPGSLEPAFSPGMQNYLANVSYLTESVKLTATKADPNAIVTGTINAEAGTPTGEATVTLGGQGTATPASLTVTAPSGASRIYSVMIVRPTRPLSDDSSLSSITLVPGTLEPDFSPAETTYTGKVGLLVGETTLSFTKSDPNAVLSRNGQVLAPAGIASAMLTVKEVGLGMPTPITVTVTSETGQHTTAYTVNVLRGLGGPMPR